MLVCLVGPEEGRQGGKIGLPSTLLPLSPRTSVFYIIIPTVSDLIVQTERKYIMN